jgi:hypothetical protein
MSAKTTSFAEGSSSGLAGARRFDFATGLSCSMLARRPATPNSPRALKVPFFEGYTRTMPSRRSFALLLAVAAAALARTARADDAATAAAAMQAIGQAGVATGGAPGAKKKDEGGGFARPLTAPTIEKTTGGSHERAAGKKGAHAKKSPAKYKSTELTDNSEHNYRFNEYAEPVDSAPKKAAAKPKKKESSDSDEKDEKTGACSSDDACPAKSSDGDAF